MSAVAVLCYELLITFRYEYEFVWHRRWSGVTWLFLSNRYLILVLVVLEAMPWSAQVSDSAVNANIRSSGL